MKRKVTCILILGFLMFALNACDKTEPVISYEQSARICNGMKYKDVREILGSDGVMLGSGWPIYGWRILGGEEIFLVDIILKDDVAVVDRVRIEPFETYEEIYFGILESFDH